MEKNLKIETLRFEKVDGWFCGLYISKDMEKEKNSKITREEALRRLETARKLKREYVAKLEKEMKEEFKKRTGQEATYFEVW